MKTSIVLENLSPANYVARALEVFGGNGGVLGVFWGKVLRVFEGVSRVLWVSFVKLGVFKGRGWLRGWMREGEFFFRVRDLLGGIVDIRRARY